MAIELEQEIEQLFLDNPDLQPSIDETTKAYRAFSDFCKMGSGRSIRKLHDEYKAKAEEDKKQGKSRAVSVPSQTLSTLFEWSSANNWVQRAKSYETSKAKIERAIEAESLRVMKDRHTNFAMALQNKVADRLQLLNPDELTPETMLKYLEVAVRMEREARGAEAADLAASVKGAGEVAQGMGARFRFVEVVKDYGNLDAGDDEENT